MLAELVGWEGQNFETLAVVLLIDLFQAFVLRCQAALAGGVDDQENLALVGIGQLDFFAVNIFDFVIQYVGTKGQSLTASQDSSRKCDEYAS